jgi:hypothetical protein
MAEVDTAPVPAVSVSVLGEAGAIRGWIQGGIAANLY